MKKLNSRSVIAAAAAGALVAGGMVAPANAQNDPGTTGSLEGIGAITTGSDDTNSPAQTPDPDNSADRTPNLGSISDALGSSNDDGTDEGADSPSEGEDSPSEGEGSLSEGSLGDLGAKITVEGSSDLPMKQIIPAALGLAAIGLGINAVVSGGITLPPVGGPAPAPGAPQVDPALVAGAVALGIGAALTIAAGSADSDTGSDLAKINVTGSSDEDSPLGSLANIDTESINTISADGATGSIDKITTGSDNDGEGTGEGSLSKITTGSDNDGEGTGAGTGEGSLSKITTGSDNDGEGTDEGTDEGSLSKITTGSNNDGEGTGAGTGEGSLGLNLDLTTNLGLGSLGGDANNDEDARA